MKVYAFDVDETLEISNGPVTLQSLMDLRNQGHIVGLCGNWAAVTQRVTGWQHLISFLNCSPVVSVNNQVIGDKSWWLTVFKQYVPAEEYVLVGNILGVTGNSDDQGAAERAGWRFICELDFAAGAR